MTNPEGRYKSTYRTRMDQILPAVVALLNIEARTPEDSVSSIIIREIPRITRNAFLSYLANALILLIVTNAVALVFGSTASSISGFFEILGFIIAAYAGIVYALTRIKLSKSLSGQFYFLALLGMSQAGILYSIAAYQLASGAYWLRQAFRQGTSRCTYDGGSVVAVDGKVLVCSTCTRKLAVGYDVPKRWIRVGNIALVLGLVLYASNLVGSSIIGTVFITYLAWLFLTNGLVFSFGAFRSHMRSARYARLPTETTGLDQRSPVR